MFVNQKVKPGNFLLKLDVLTGGLHLNNLGHIHQRWHELALQFPRRESTSLDLRIIKVIVDVVEHHDGGEFDDFEMFALGQVGFGRKEQIGEIDAGGERRAHFVRDVRAVHRSEAVTGFLFPKELQSCDVLQED